MAWNQVSRYPPRNANANLKRRSSGVGEIHGYSRRDLRYVPPQKQARTLTEFESTNKVPLYHSSFPRVSNRYGPNFPGVKGSYGHVSSSDVRNNAIQNRSPFVSVSVSSQPMTNPNYRQYLPCQNLSGFRTFKSETASFPLHQQKQHDNSFDSLPEWDPNEPTFTIQSEFVPKPNMPVNDFSNGSLNSFTIPVSQNINSCPMTNVAQLPNPVAMNNGNVVPVPIPIPTQVMSQPIQSWVGNNDLSDLLNTLKNKGLISLTDDKQKQNMEVNKQKDELILGLEFDASLLKVRHESVIKALYSDLPRQCTACGLRFKCQEDHRNHMDWHVRKNRMAKDTNQKKKKKQVVQKLKRSRQWFGNADLWLSAVTGERLDDKVIAELFNAGKENDKKEDGEKEFVVPADDDQRTCALCKEPFEDFFSDEADEWLYRGAMYLNMHKETIAAMATTTCERSLLGPIVHVKCMPAEVIAKDLRGGKVPGAVPVPSGALVY